MCNELRQIWYSKLTIPQNFSNLKIAEKLKQAFNPPENVKFKSQFIVDAFNIRCKIVHK